jgi:hypothetical protein
MSMAMPPPDDRSWFPTFKRLHHTPLRDVLRGKGLTGRLDWERTLAASGLPEAMRTVVRQVVKQRPFWPLWPFEKMEVCDELIAHFTDGLAEGESPAALVKNFGDAKVAAKLIRRAKERQRPLWWHGFKWGVRGLAALVVLYAGLAMWYATDKVVVSRDYLAEINAVAV